jgi:tRNA threonylcarbamoyl adenosine modification protein (Sua5/YciO/YrdC/YwlC family)
MTQYFKVHPVNPQRRLLERAADVVRAGGLIVYPTDSCYAFGCGLGEKAALDRIRVLRQTTVDHEFTLVCRDLSEISVYAKVDKWAYRLLRARTPGPYTFILRASGEVPKRLQMMKRRTIGIRVPDHVIALSLLEVYGEPLLSSTLLLPTDPLPLTDPEAIRELLERRVDAIIDGGVCGLEPTTVLDLSEETVNVVRVGKGDISDLA